MAGIKFHVTTLYKKTAHLFHQLFEKHAFSIISIFTAFVSLALLAIIIWGTNKGFDLTDEGLYLLKYQNHQECFAYFSQFHIIVRKLFGWMGPTILNLRIARLILTITSTYIMTYGLVRWLKTFYKIKTETKTGLLVFSITLIGSFLSYTFGAQSLSYNHLISFCLLFSTGLVFIALSRHQATGVKFLLYFMAGLFAGIAVFIKITSALPFILIITVYIYLHHKKIKGKGTAISIASLYAGIAAFILFYFFSISSLADYLQNFGEITKTSTREASDHTLGFYIKDTALTLLKIIEYGVFAFITLSFFHRLQNVLKEMKMKQFNPFSARFILNSFSLPVLIVMAYLLYDKLLYLHFAGPYLLIFIFAPCIMLFNYLKKKVRQFPSFHFWSTAILLFVIPFIGAFGSNNGLIINSIYFTGFWFAALLLFYYEQLISRQSLLTIVFILTILCLMAFPKNYIREPYRQLALTKQTEQLKQLPNGKGILVDSATKQYVNQIYDTLKNNGFKQHDPIIGTYKIPGIIYLVDGTAPGSIIWDEKRTDEFLPKSLKNSEKELQQSIFIMQNHCSQKLIRNLKAFGIHFPENYELKGTIRSKKYPETKIFFPKDE